MSEQDKAVTDAMAALQEGEFSELLNRVKEAQSKIAELKGQQNTQLHPHEIASITSLILHDMIDLRAQTLPASLAQMVEQVMVAGVQQQGRLLGVQFAEAK